MRRLVSFSLFAVAAALVAASEPALAQVSGTIYGNCYITTDWPHKSGGAVKSRAYGSCSPTASNPAIEHLVEEVEWSTSNHLFYSIPCPPDGEYEVGGVFSWLLQYTCGLTLREVDTAGPATGYPLTAPRWARNRLIVTSSCSSFFDTGEYAALSITTGTSPNPDVRAGITSSHTGYHLISCP